MASLYFTQGNSSLIQLNLWDWEMLAVSLKIAACQPQPELAGPLSPQC